MGEIVSSFVKVDLLKAFFLVENPWWEDDF